MKEYKQLLIYILIIIVLIIVSIVAYNHLTQEYTPQQVTNETQKIQHVKKASDFSVYNNNGDKVSLSEYKGKPVVVNFWATWCGPCKMELPAFDKLCTEYKEQVEFMMVNLTDGYQETLESAKQFISESGYMFPVFFDTENNASAEYNLYSIPRTIFVDKDGNLVNSHVGAMSEATLRKYIQSLIGES